MQKFCRHKPTWKPLVLWCSVIINPSACSARISHPALPTNKMFSSVFNEPWDYCLVTQCLTWPSVGIPAASFATEIQRCKHPDSFRHVPTARTTTGRDLRYDVKLLIVHVSFERFTLTKDELKFNIEVMDQLLVLFWWFGNYFYCRQKF